MDEIISLLWAKTNKEKTVTHPLICHMVDVSMVALTLWEEALPDGIRTHMAAYLGADIEAAGRLLAFWAGLHDLGKASRCFQEKFLPVRDKLKALGLDFLDKPMVAPCLHGHITCKSLKALLMQESGLSEPWAKRVALSVGGHHGEWPSSLNIHTAPPLVGGKTWDHVRRQLYLSLKEVLDLHENCLNEPSLLDGNSFSTLLSGFVSVADWLGSMDEYFQPWQNEINLQEYLGVSKIRAHQALDQNGWLGWKPPQSTMKFTDLCKVPSPRPLQQAVIDLSEQLIEPGLVLIEAPTGEGKTEAALYLADHWTLKLQQRGVYVAMPTMATSNSMFTRVADVIKRRYKDEKFVGYHLLHGNALLEENEDVPRLSNIYEDRKNSTGNLGSSSWFTKQKRGFLAPFAVGTVDQALLSILQTPHFFVRLFGLSHKTIIFDEVHAYDTYMDILFFRLLGWLRAVGASVVILSATLPEEARRKILEAYTGQTINDISNCSYPAISWTTGGKPQTIPFPASAPRELVLKPIERDPEVIAQILETEMTSGGCAAVICNTVRRAQDVYRVLQNRKIVPEGDLYLFHARFPLEWRFEIEKKVNDVFNNRASDEAPRRASIVVATQVIEQSLDLDFDMMISDLAPVDLLLQRAGRLHRNPQRRNRPTGLQTPRLLVAMPQTERGVPVLDKGDEAVYDPYILLRTFLVLKNNPEIKIPNQLRDMLEAVYGPENRMPGIPSDEYHRTLSKAREKMDKEHEGARNEAKQKLVRLPNDPDLLTSPIIGLEEDNPELHKFIRAATRQSRPSVSLICLHHTPEGIALDPSAGSPLVDINVQPDMPTTRALVSQKIEVTNRQLVDHFINQPTPDGWKKSPWLRYSRCVEFDGGVYKPDNEDWILHLDHDLGLFLSKGE